MIEFLLLIILRPPRSTRTDTLLPSTTPCHSPIPSAGNSRHCSRYPTTSHNLPLLPPAARGGAGYYAPIRARSAQQPIVDNRRGNGYRSAPAHHRPARESCCPAPPRRASGKPRSEERRVGTEGVSRCSSRGSPYH